MCFEYKLEWWCLIRLQRVVLVWKGGSVFMTSNTYKRNPCNRNPFHQYIKHGSFLLITHMTQSRAEQSREEQQTQTITGRGRGEQWEVSLMKCGWGDMFLLAECECEGEVWGVSWWRVGCVLDLPAVLGTTSARSSMVIRPASLPPMVISKKTLGLVDILDYK